MSTPAGAPGEISRPPYPAPADWTDGGGFSAGERWALGVVTLAAGLGSALLTGAGSPIWGLAVAVLFGLLALLDTALALYQRQPWLREELSTSRAQGRIESWSVRID